MRCKTHSYTYLGDVTRAGILIGFRAYEVLVSFAILVDRVPTLSSRLYNIPVKKHLVM